MDDTVLIAALKYGFLALLALFVYFTVRTVAITLRVPATERTSGPSGAKPATKQRKAVGGSGVPNVVIVRTGGKKIGTFKLKEGLTLGRAEECGLCPPDDYLSQFHARFVRRDGAWFVEDMGSTNGTFLNDQKLSGPMEVRAGDEVRAGTTKMELRR
jgi:hypothetical protein